MADDWAIRVEHLSKSYRIAHQRGGRGMANYRRLSEDVVDWVRRPVRGLSRWLRETPAAGGTTTEEFWALKDVSFDVKRGEVIGIIGRNGAGKSTLLKLLSRITEPTTGRIEIDGRVASLLEVGTGFHPELTGRENIFLNGAILGMSRADVRSRFDAIVSFAEVDRFIDTPIKRYSSGMYLRLAFAVAAHLEPEVLIVDEVLAVGDFDFQNKCLGKMKDVAGSGRTVLFVSHNMGAVQQLCQRAILLDGGSISNDGNVNETIKKYLKIGINQDGERVWLEPESAPSFDNIVRIRAIRVRDSAGAIRALFDVKEALEVEVEYEVLTSKHSLNIHLYFRDDRAQTLFVSMDNLDSPWRDRPHPGGHYAARCRVPANFLNEGVIRVEYLICTRPTTGRYVTVPDAIAFEVTDDRRPDGVRGNWSRDWPQATVRPRLSWTVGPARSN